MNDTSENFKKINQSILIFFYYLVNMLNTKLISIDLNPIPGSMDKSNGVFTVREAGNYRDKASNNIALSCVGITRFQR